MVILTIFDAANDEPIVKNDDFSVSVKSGNVTVYIC